jgi:hypothetical protein
MDIPNAFIGKAALPTEEELASALGPAAVDWQELVDWFAEQKVVDQEWKSSGKNTAGLFASKSKREISSI